MLILARGATLDETFAIIKDRRIGGPPSLNPLLPYPYFISEQMANREIARGQTSDIILFFSAGLPIVKVGHSKRPRFRPDTIYDFYSGQYLITPGTRRIVLKRYQLAQDIKLQDGRRSVLDKAITNRIQLAVVYYRLHPTLRERLMIKLTQAVGRSSAS